MRNVIFDLDYFGQLWREGGEGSLILYEFCKDMFLFQEYLCNRFAAIRPGDQADQMALDTLVQCARLISGRLGMDREAFLGQTPESIVGFYRSRWNRPDWSWETIILSLRNALFRVIVVSLQGYLSIFAEYFPKQWIEQTIADIQPAYALFMLIDDQPPSWD